MNIDTLPIIVINGFPERREALEGQLSGAGVSEDRVEWLHAHTQSSWRFGDVPDGEVILPSPYWRDKTKPKLRSNGHQNCLHAHRAAWKRVLSEYGAAIIIEDDVNIGRELPSTVAEVWKDSHDVAGTIHYLGYKTMADWPAADEEEEWRVAPFCWWACGYVIDSVAARILLDASGASLGIPVDELMPYLYCRWFTENRNGLVKVNTKHFLPPAYCASTPYVSPSGRDGSRTETKDAAFNLEILILGTDEAKIDPYVTRLRERNLSVMKIGVGERGWDTSREGGRQKFEWIAQYLGSKDRSTLTNTIYLCLDGYDTDITAAGVGDLLQRYGSLRWPCIVSGEKNYWPKRGLEDSFASREYGDSEGEGGKAQLYNYPCSGAFIGPGCDLYVHIDWALTEYPDEADDQALMHRIVLQESSYWRVDDGAALFQSIHLAEKDISGPTNTATGTNPLVWHANGPSEFPATDTGIPLAHVPVDAPDVVMQLGRMQPYNRLYGRQQQFITLPNDMYMLPLLSGEDAELLLSVLQGLNHNFWAPLADDNVPGDEYRGDRLDELKALVEMHCLPQLNQLINPARIGGVRDIFAIRTGVAQDRLPLHTDISHMSGSIKLQSAEEGGELYFPRQNWSDRHLPVGASVWWPSAITHPHTTLPVTKGQRVAVTIWTDR